MTEERKEQLIQKAINKGLCREDAELIFNKAFQYAAVKGEYVVEYYVLDLADLLTKTTFFKKKSDKPFKISTDASGAMIICE
jgi:hypothetical protein